MDIVASSREKKDVETQLSEGTFIEGPLFDAKTYLVAKKFKNTSYTDRCIRTRSPKPFFDVFFADEKVGDMCEYEVENIVFDDMLDFIRKLLILFSSVEDIKI